MLSKKKVQIAFLVATAIIVIASTFFYNKSVVNIYKKQALFSVHQNAEKIAEEINTIVKDAGNCVELSSRLISDNLTSSEFVRPDKTILPYVYRTPFNVMEYIKADGSSTVYSEKRFNAQNYEYFKEGMKGYSGVWINYFPATFDDVMINFYAPVKFHDNVTGVLTGGILGKGNIQQYLDSNFMGHKTIGVLVDKDYKVIASTYDGLTDNLDLKKFRDTPFIDSMITLGEYQSEEPFLYKLENNKTGAACITKVASTDWHVIQIIPVDAFKAGTNEIIGRMIIAVVIIVVFLCSFLLFFYLQSRKESEALEKKHMNLISALSSAYQNVYVVNKENSDLFIYSMSKWINSSYKTAFQNMKYEEAIRMYVKNEVFEDDFVLFEMINTVTKVDALLRDKNEYSFIYRVVREGNIQHYQCYLFQTNENKKEFLAGFKNVDDLIWTSEDQRELQTVQEALNAGAWSMDFDRNFHIVRCNWSDAFRRMIGYVSADELPNRINGIDPYIKEEDLDEVSSKLSETINDISGKKTYDATFRVLTKNRGYRWYHVVGRIRRRRDGSPQHLVGLFVDVDEETNRMKNLISLAGVYHSMHMIDLVNNTFVEISAAADVKTYVTEPSDAAQQMHYSMENLCVEESKPLAFEFTNLQTLAERMKGKKMISVELESRTIGWFQLSYVAVETDHDGKPTKVILTTMQIDEQKKAVQHLEITANTDELTGFLNRHAYENTIHQYDEISIPEDLIYVSIDVNGLKGVNDNLGHEAGDELLTGAAYCIAEAFSEFGKTFRVGGDEFIAIINTSDGKLHEIQSDFRSLLAGWKGKLVKELSVSCGYVEAKDFSGKSIQELAKIADQRMYKDKALYYSNRGIDRRGQQTAFDLLCKAYTKILKVNLTTDSFSIIKMDQNEKNALKGYCESISKWLHDFGTTGQVHKDDLNEYLEKTDLNYLKDYFSKGNNQSFALYYRRMTGNAFIKVLMEIIPAEEYSDSNRIVYLYVKNMEKIPQAE